MGKVEQSRERSSAPLHLGVVPIEKGAFWSPLTTVTDCTTFIGVTSNQLPNVGYLDISVITTVYGVMVTVVGNGHGDSSSNPGRDYLHFT